jgi:2-oxoglutarate ferredoxin oxidoreductase subunit delta
MPEQLSWAQRLHVEDLRPESGDAIFGTVWVDPDRCTGCGYCVRACPANTLELAAGSDAPSGGKKKARMATTLPMCMSCGDCSAICPESAITITAFIEFFKYFKYLDRGQPQPPRRL